MRSFPPLLNPLPRIVPTPGSSTTPVSAKPTEFCRLIVYCQPSHPTGRDAVFEACGIRRSPQEADGGTTEDSRRRGGDMTINEREENAYTLAVQAGLWGYPLAHRVEAFPRTLEAKGAGRNSFRKFDRLKSAEDLVVVTPNNLTIDGYALLDLADGPVVIDVPKLADERCSSCRSAMHSTTSSSTSADHAPRSRRVSDHRRGIPGPASRRHDPGQLPHQHRIRGPAHRGQQRR